VNTERLKLMTKRKLPYLIKDKVDRKNSSFAIDDFFTLITPLASKEKVCNECDLWLECTLKALGKKSARAMFIHDITLTRILTNQYRKNENQHIRVTYKKAAQICSDPIR